MLTKGNKQFEVVGPGTLVIECDQVFTLYELGDDGKIRVLGPRDANHRYLAVYLEGQHKLALETKGLWSFAFDDRSRGDPSDPVPMEIPVGMARPEPLEDMIRRYIHQEVSVNAQDSGRETFQEANDFDIEDEIPDPLSPYEMLDMQEEEPIPAEPAAPEAVLEPSGDEITPDPGGNPPAPPETAPRTREEVSG